MPARKLRVAVVGLGPIGRAVAKEIVRARDLVLVGAVDPAEGIAGEPLAELLGPGAGRGKVLAHLDGLKRTRVDVAVHLAASRFPQARDHVLDLVERGYPVVSTCEELIAAAYRWPRRAKAIDTAARAAGVPVIATGVNPGFVMDLLPAALSNVCVSVRSVRVTRHVDTSTRRRALQDKTGAGISRTEFRDRARRNAVGHVGLRDSLLFLVNHLPLDAEVGEEKLRPIIAAKRIAKGRRRIEKGAVAGVHQTVKATDRGTGRTVAAFDLKMAFGLADPHDRIVLDGDPSLSLRFDGGVSGDRATIGAVLSTIRYAADAPPGFGV